MIRIELELFLKLGITLHLFLASLSKGNDCRLAGELGVFLAEEIIQKSGSQFDIKIMERLKETII